MTDIRNKKKAATVTKMTNKHYSEIKVVKDIFKLINELKRTAHELEDIAMDLQTWFIDDKEPKSVSENLTKDEDAIKTTNILESSHYTLKCDSCSESFKRISDLENHIKSRHEDYKTFQCDHCCKNFVTNWRLEKHKKMHYQTHVKKCQQYTRREYCPYNELGCKFRHEEDLTVNVGDTVDIMIETNSDMLDVEDTQPFLTSTPILDKGHTLKLEEDNSAQSTLLLQRSNL